MSSLKFQSPLEYPQMHTALPSPSAQSRVLYLRKRIRSPWFRLPAPSAGLLLVGPHSARAAWSSPFSLPKPCGSLSFLPPNHVVLSPFSPKTTYPLSGMTVAPGFKSQHQSSSAAPFLTPPIISYTCQHSCILPALLGCHSKSEQKWFHGVGSIFSRLSCRHCNQGKLLPSYILAGSHSHVPGSKLGHSYLTYLWNQSNVIDMLNTMPEVSCTAVAIQNSSEWPCSMCPFPELRLVGVRTSYIYFSNISWTPWVLDPHYKSLFGALLLAYPVTVWHSLGILFQNFWAIKQSKLIPNCWPLLPVIVSCQLDSTKATKK